jgi:hypothetical protein
MCCCPVQLLCLQEMTDFKEQCIWIRLLLQIGTIGADTFQVLTLGSIEAYCSIWSAEYRNGMTSVKDAAYSGCLPSSRVCRYVEHIYWIWHESRCITVLKFVNELGNLLVYVVKFWHQIEFVIDCVKISALCADWWTETIRIASVRTRTLRRNVRHSHFLSEVITYYNMPLK